MKRNHSELMKSETHITINHKLGLTNYNNFSLVYLKPNHETRPLWITPDRHIFLETFSPIYNYAYEFIISIAEPLSRPAFIHEYVITKYSLYAAMVLQLTPMKIKDFLLTLAKNKELPIEVSNYIDENTLKYGSAKLFLHNNNYYLEILDKNVKKEIKNKKEMVELIESVDKNIFSLDFQIDQQIKENPNLNKAIEEVDKFFKEKLVEEMEELISKERNMTKKKSSYYYLIKGDHYPLAKAFMEMNIPLIEEYSLVKKDTENNPVLEIELKPSTKIRHYQEKALSKIFIEGKARSGIIVLPCGAGKTLVGIAACAMIKRRAIIFCSTGLVIEQWKAQIKKFCDIADDKIICLYSKSFNQEKFNQYKKSALIIITTYTMIAKNRTKDKTQQKRIVIEEMKRLEWGVCILDEVQVVPANTFQRAHFKLGLTATLLREDLKIEDLNYMIGPKLYEENWLDLVNQGFLARPYCIEVRLPMTKEFLDQYKKEKNKEGRILLYAGNPNKFLTLQYLISKHEERGDKIIVFGDKPYILVEYAKRLNLPVGTGDVKLEERQTIFNYFQKRNINTIFLSSIGDTSIDLPEANVIIQISSFFGSRKQEAQRLGRILRPKENDFSQYNAFFYTLVSLETDETLYAAKRQKFLIDQGFSFEIVTELPYMNNERIRNKMPVKFDAEEQFKWLNKLKVHGNDNLDSDSIDSEDTDESSGDIKEVSALKTFNSKNLYVEEKKK